jgi:hypothetical protein
MKTRYAFALRLAPSIGAVLIAVSAYAVALPGADAPLQGQALLIGIQDYELADKLRGVMNDVGSLAEALKDRGGYTVETVRNSANADVRLSAGGRSECESLQQRIADWLAQRTPAESVFLYFSGHGFRDEEDHLYLAAKDCDPKNPKPGGIPVAWLREQLLQCKAGAKLLVLDTCHAGNARSAATRGTVTAKELQDIFQQTEGLVTLASCSGDQQSYLWPAKNQSIFTYWLVQGLRGHADREPLGEITLNELDDFITRKVRRTASVLTGLDQTPTRLQGPNVTQDVVVHVQPVDLKTLLDDIAEQMDVLIRLGKLQRVGVVPELANDVTCQTLGRQYGTLATHCPVELANRLAFRSSGEYRVLNTNAVRELLQSHRIAGKDIGAQKCKEMAADPAGLNCLIAGYVESLQDDRIVLQCKLLDLASGDELGTAGGCARLCASELAMQGISGRVEPLPPSSSPSPADSAPSVGEPGAPSDGRESGCIVSAVGHPLQDPTFPFHARILVKGADGKFRERPFTFNGNQCFVSLSRGEVFQIRYMSDSRVFAKVLVDGLNTLPERSQTKGVEVEPVLRTEFQPAQPVSLAEARAWGPLVPAKEYAVSGFYLKVGDEGEVDEFKVVDATQSLAADAGYTDQQGLITLAFYQPQAKQRSEVVSGTRSALATGRGDRYRQMTDLYSGDEEPGRILATVHIHYGK